MSFRALPLNETFVAKLAALAALGLIASIVFGLGHPAKAASPLYGTISSVLPRCSGR